MPIRMSPNQREVIGAISTVTGQQEYLYSTNHRLNVTGADLSLTPSSTMNATSSDGSTPLTNSAQAIKATAGVLTGYFIYNPNGAATYIQFYNTVAASVTVGTTVPLFMLTLPSGSAANLSYQSPVTFSTAMSWAATSTAGGNGAPATALEAVAWYQ